MMRKTTMWAALLGVGLFLAGMTTTAFAQAAAPVAPAPAAAAPAVGAAPAANAPATGLELTPEEAAKHKGQKSELNIVQIIIHSGFFGILIWLALITCSIISVALTVDSFVNVKEGYEVIQDSVGIAADIEAEQILQRVTYLSVIANTTPMLGLIGTVQGMIMAFLNLGTQAAGAAQQAMLATNISHGLWATAVGLGTAVPATIFFYYFKNKAMRIILGMEALTLDLIKSLRNVEVVEE